MDADSSNSQTYQLRNAPEKEIRRDDGSKGKRWCDGQGASDHVISACRRRGVMLRTVTFRNGRPAEPDAREDALERKPGLLAHRADVGLRAGEQEQHDVVAGHQQGRDRAVPASPRVAVLAAGRRGLPVRECAYAAEGPPVCTTLVVAILPPVTVAVPW